MSDSNGQISAKGKKLVTNARNRVLYTFFIVVGCVFVYFKSVEAGYIDIPF